MARVLLSHRSQLVRQLLRRLVPEHGHEIVGEAESGAVVVELCRRERPDVLLTEAALADGAFDDHLEPVLRTGARVVVLSEDPSPERVTVLLGGGASGYLLADCAPEQVAEAITAVADGNAALHPAVADTILEQWRRLRVGFRTNGHTERLVLTPREREVLGVMAEGLSTKAIANRLGIARKTVESHKVRIFDKLGVRSQAQAAVVAIRHGLLADDMPSGQV